MTFTLEVRDQIATITLDRPEVRNALTTRIVENLAAAVTDGESRQDIERGRSAR